MELPALKCYTQSDDGCTEWYNKLYAMYFFSNQNELFDCFLVLLNKEVFIYYEYTNPLSVDFMKFVVKTLPTNKLEKKKRFYRPTNSL